MGATPRVRGWDDRRVSGGDLRVAIIGYGRAGRVFHAPLVAATAGMEVARIVTVRRPRVARRRPVSTRARASSPRPTSCGRHRATVDLVVVAAPNRAHVPLARASRSPRAFAVVVDKPLAPTAAEGRALVAEAGAPG